MRAAYPRCDGAWRPPHAGPTLQILPLLLLNLPIAAVLGYVQPQNVRVVQNEYDDVVWNTLPGPATPWLLDLLESTQSYDQVLQDVRIDSSITVQFAEPIQIGNGYITITPALSTSWGSHSLQSPSYTILDVSSVTAGVVVDATAGKEDKLVINPYDVAGSMQELTDAITGTATPQEVFASSTSYTIHFDADVVRSTSGSDFSTSFSIQFITGDFEAPTQVSVSPYQSEEYASYTNGIVLTFSETVQAGQTSLSMALTDMYGRTAASNVPCSDSDIIFNGATATIAPTSLTMGACHKYQFEYPAYCFADASAQKMTALGQTHDFFTSCIVDFKPLAGETGVPINTIIELEFAESIQIASTTPITLNFLGLSTPVEFDPSDSSEVSITGNTLILSKADPQYLCGSLTVQHCKGKPVDLHIDSGILTRVDASLSAADALLPTQLSGSSYRFTLRQADLTPPVITIVSMYGISETVIRVTIRLNEGGTSYCNAFLDTGIYPTLDYPRPTIDKTGTATAFSAPITDQFVGSSDYDPVLRYAEHEVDVTGLSPKTYYRVYCFSEDQELPYFNVVRSPAMLETGRLVRTLDTTAPSMTDFNCTSYAGSESKVEVTWSQTEDGRVYCKVVTFYSAASQPSPNAIIAENFYADVVYPETVTIVISSRITGMGATGTEALFPKTDYDVFCWAEDAEGYPYHGPNGMAEVVKCPDGPVTTLDLTPPSLTFVMAESTSNSQIKITLQVNEGAKVWCAAWNTDPGLTPGNYIDSIKGESSSCMMDLTGEPCGTFWIYDLDDLEDDTADLVATQPDYDAAKKYNQDFDIVLNNLLEETPYPYIFCFAEDDEVPPNQMIFDDAGQAGGNNVHTIQQGIGTVITLDETPPSFTRLEIEDPAASNTQLVITFQLSEAGTAFCRVTRTDSGETTLRINRILSANFPGYVASPAETGYITVYALDADSSEVLHEASQYNVYCWAKDEAVDTQNQPRPMYMTQAYIDSPVADPLSPQGGKTEFVWTSDLTPPAMIYVSSEALAQETIQITLQLDEPGTVWCQPAMPSTHATYLDPDEVAADYENQIKQTSTNPFMVEVPEAYVNVDVELNKIMDTVSGMAVKLEEKTLYIVYCFAQDDWDTEFSTAAYKSINFPPPPAAQPAQKVLWPVVDDFQNQIGEVQTLDLTPPLISMINVTSTETVISVVLELDEAGTAYCQAVRKDFNMPTILEILDTDFSGAYPGPDGGETTVEIRGYDRPINSDNGYVSPLVLGTDYDVYCYAHDNLCNGCKVTNGVDPAHVEETKTRERTQDTTRPYMRFVAAESIKYSEIQITLQVDEGAKVWCAAWESDPGIAGIETSIKDQASFCLDTRNRECGTFWVYDLDDIEDSAIDGHGDDNVYSISDYEDDNNWKYNQDVDIILNNLIGETLYHFIYCFAEDDEATPNKMSDSNIQAMQMAIGTIKTLDETPPSFTYLAMTDPTDHNDRIIVTFSMNEAGTAYCRVTLTKSGETTLRINQILSANYYASVASAADVAHITVDKLESKDMSHNTLYEAQRYDVYCWAKDDAVDSQQMPRPNYMSQSYVDTLTTDPNNPLGGYTKHVWVKDLTAPTITYVSSEALSDTVIQITLQLNEPGTVWCTPVEDSSATHLDVASMTDDTYEDFIKHGGFFMVVPDPYVNVDVEVDKLSALDLLSSERLQPKTDYYIYCFAEDDWKIEAMSAADPSGNFDEANTAVPNATASGGNPVTLDAATNLKDEIGQVKTLDLLPPIITIENVTSTEVTITVTLSLDEGGTAWCQAVRKDFDIPPILLILDTDFQSPVVVGSSTTVLISGYDRPFSNSDAYTPLVLGTDYDVYCYAEDDLCSGCKVTNGVTYAQVEATKETIRTLDLEVPQMTFVTAESIRMDEILVTLQVHEGSKVWCAAWTAATVTSPMFASDAAAESEIKGKSADCRDGKGRECGSFWVYDLDDTEDGSDDGVTTYTDYITGDNWKYEQDVDIIVGNLVDETGYRIFCFAEDDEDPPNQMYYDESGNYGASNIYTISDSIGVIMTLDETPPSFTKLAIQDPSVDITQLKVTFQLNEPGTAYCRVTLSNSGETTLRINQILTADYAHEVIASGIDGIITVDKLEQSATRHLYESSQYDVYCWAKDSAVDTNGLARPNYMQQDYVETAVGDVLNPNGGYTANVWIVDKTAPEIIVVTGEAIAMDTIQVTLQLNEPGTIWCQPVPAYAAADYCLDGDMTSVSGGHCYFETYIKGQDPSTINVAHVAEPYTDYDINMQFIGKQADPTDVSRLLSERPYKIWCFAEDDWTSEAISGSINFDASSQQVTKIDFVYATSVSETIGAITTLDQTEPAFVDLIFENATENDLTVKITLNEPGTAWCMPVQANYAEPSVNEILQNNEFAQIAAQNTPYSLSVQGLLPKTEYDVWCYAEDDNTYPQRPNGRKADMPITLMTLDTTPPILTIVSAESPTSSEIRVKVKMEEPGTVYCRSYDTSAGGAGGINFHTISDSNNFLAYVGLGLSPGGPINTNVEVVVSSLTAETEYETYCTAIDINAPSPNFLTDTDTFNTKASVGLIKTLDSEPARFAMLRGWGVDDYTIRVDFRCDEPCRAYCRVTRSDSGESSLSINRILKADYFADWMTGGADSSILIDRLENDASLPRLERGTLYDVYCWTRDEAVQHSCYAYGAGATCETFPKPNYAGQTYVDTHYGGSPPAEELSPSGGHIRQVRTRDEQGPVVVFIEAESTEETSITVTLQLDEPGTAYCKAFATPQNVGDAGFFSTLSSGTVYQNVVRNWNNIYKNFDVKVLDLSAESTYYVYCAAEDDELAEGTGTISPTPSSNNEGQPILTEASGRSTLDLTPPSISPVSIESAYETVATYTFTLDEPGTVWCKAVRDMDTAPTINQVIAAGFSIDVTMAHTEYGVDVKNLDRDTEYDVYCHARDRGTEVPSGVPAAGNPGNDASSSHMLSTLRDIHTEGDSTKPVVIGVTPPHGGTEAAAAFMYILQFNEDVWAPTAGNLMSLRLGGSQESVYDVQTAVSNPTSCSGTPGYQARFEIVNRQLILDYASCNNLDAGTYELVMEASAVSDLSLNTVDYHDSTFTISAR